MSIPVWPATLPQTLLIDGHSDGFADNRLRSEMDTGPAKLRRRSTAGIEPLMGTLIFTTAQWATLRTFWEDTTVGGTLRFSWDSPTADHGAVEVRFESAPTRTAVTGQYYEVLISLEVLP